MKGAIRLLAFGIVFGAAMTELAFAAEPINREGKHCPTGYFKSGDYCTPAPSNRASAITRPGGATCPPGYFKSGKYCKEAPSNRRTTINRSGSDCPAGFTKVGKYCRKPR